MVPAPHDPSPDATPTAAGLPVLAAAPTGSDMERTSERLRLLGDQQTGDQVSMANLVGSLHRRAFGLSLLLFALPNCLPTIPGFSTVTGLMLLVIAGQMVAGRETLLLPRALGRRTVSTRHLRGIIARVLPSLRRVERFCRPRRAVFTERMGRRLMGCVIIILSAILMLPIPFIGNQPPGLAIVVLALGLTERDGLVVVIGYGLSVLAAIITLGGTAAALGALWLLVADHLPI